MTSTFYPDVQSTKTAAPISARKLAIFSANVARQRKTAGVSKTEFASHTTVSRDTIRRIETRPEGYIPSEATIKALAQLAGTTSEKILSTRLKFA
jgi:transcriptional regulator with XRE-family HTH domain